MVMTNAIVGLCNVHTFTLPLFESGYSRYNAMCLSSTEFKYNHHLKRTNYIITKFKQMTLNKLVSVCRPFCVNTDNGTNRPIKF